MATMRYRTLGRSGLRVSELCLGTMMFGGPTDQTEAQRIADNAAELGINFIDTANVYEQGRSEEVTGRIIKARRNHWILASKLAQPTGPGPNDRGLSRRHLKRQVERSLARLGVERLDLFLIHEPDPETPLEETLEALDDLIHQGKIHYIGASNIEAWRLAKALEVSESHALNRFEWVQNGFSLLDRGDRERVFPVLHEHGVGYTPFSPLAGGWLTGKYRRDEAVPAGSRMTMTSVFWRLLPVAVQRPTSRIASSASCETGSSV